MCLCLSRYKHIYIYIYIYRYTFEKRISKSVIKWTPKLTSRSIVRQSRPQLYRGCSVDKVDGHPDS